jgi:hypothetical protein
MMWIKEIGDETGFPTFCRVSQEHSANVGVGNPVSSPLMFPGDAISKTFHIMAKELHIYNIKTSYDHLGYSKVSRSLPTFVGCWGQLPTLDNVRRLFT